MEERLYFETESGEAARLFTLSNGNGVRAEITNFGGIIVSLHTPDRDGEIQDVVLGFDEGSDYLQRHPYFGAIVGRYANRIAGARFPLEGQTVELTANTGAVQLHGGRSGFDRKLWNAEAATDGAGEKLRLTYVSPAGEEGYPGELSARVTYRLTEENELRIDYRAISDRATIVNLTNHSYFNLGSGATILDHRLMIHGDFFLPMGESMTPTGEVRPVEGTPMDFRQPTPIGERIDSDYHQLAVGQGYDHNWVLSHPRRELGLAATVVEPNSGRKLEVLTDKPGVQFYSGNLLPGVSGKGGRVYRPRTGFCLETQHFPDSPNQPHFPSPVLRPGELYEFTTIFRFSVEDK